MFLQSFLAKGALLLASLAYLAGPAGASPNHVSIADGALDRAIAVDRPLAGGKAKGDLFSGEESRPSKGRASTNFILHSPFKEESRWQDWTADPAEMMPMAVKGQVKLFGVRNQKFLFGEGDTWFVYGLPGRTILAQKKYGFDYAGTGGWHDGLDFVAAPDQPVVAAADGQVVFVGNYLGGTVIIDHGSGLVTTYGYLSKIKVKPGFRVKAGQEIGRVAAPPGEPRVAGRLHFSLDRIIAKPTSDRDRFLRRGSSSIRVSLNPLEYLDLSRAIIPEADANAALLEDRLFCEQIDR